MSRETYAYRRLCELRKRERGCCGPSGFGNVQKEAAAEADQFITDVCGLVDAPTVQPIRQRAAPLSDRWGSRLSFAPSGRRAYWLPSPLRPLEQP